MALPAKTLTARQFFARGGPLSRWHPNYEFRPGQLEMAEAVESAISEHRHLLVEAGTGTGKTLAYLVPAILSSKRVVVSTGTKNLQEQLFFNLQEQLFFKDVPFLARNFSKPLRVCYMKGRANYACRQKIYDAEREPLIEGLEEAADFRIIREWEKTTETGDRAEIRTLPENTAAWSKLDARRDLCTGQQCPQFERCFITQMHQRAHESDIIIVNHYLFFADLAVKDGDFGGIIPEYGTVVLDEAHEIEDIAGQFFGIGVSSYQFQDLVRDARALARRKQFGSQELDRILDVLAERSAFLFSLFGEGMGRAGFTAHTAFLERHEDHYSAVLHALELLGAHLKLIKDAPEEVSPLLRRSGELSQNLQFWMRGDDKKYVYWIERRGRGCFLQATPIDVSSILTERLFQTADTVTMTSATLAVGGSFEFAERRLGLSGARTLLVPSHFDYKRQTLLYVAQHLPGSAEPGLYCSRSYGNYQAAPAKPRACFRTVYQPPADAPGL